MFSISQVQQLYTVGTALLEAYLLLMANNQQTRKERLSQEQNGRSCHQQLFANVFMCSTQGYHFEHHLASD